MWYWIKTLSGLWWHRKSNRAEHEDWTEGWERIVNEPPEYSSPVKFKDGIVLAPPVVPVKWGEQGCRNVGP